jgi:hypothetical protein
VLREKTLSSEAESDGEEHSASYIPDDSGDYPMPEGYLRIEIEDSHSNVAYSQPLRVIGAPVCPVPTPALPTCSKTSCADLSCCSGYHCCGDRCYPDNMACP